MSWDGCRERREGRERRLWWSAEKRSSGKVRLEKGGPSSTEKKKKGVKRNSQREVKRAETSGERKESEKGARERRRSEAERKGTRQRDGRARGE